MYMILNLTPSSLLGKTGRLHPWHYHNLVASLSSILFYFFYFYFNIYVYGCLYLIHACKLYTCSAHRSQKKELSLLKLDLQIVRSCHLGAGVQLRSSGRATSALSLQAISPASYLVLWGRVFNWSGDCQGGWAGCPATPRVLLTSALSARGLQAWPTMPVVLFCILLLW